MHKLRPFIKGAPTNTLMLNCAPPKKERVISAFVINYI